MKVKISDDAEIVSEIKAKLAENGGFCPCSPVKTPDTKCMCKAFREQIKNKIPGECHCGLYEIVNTEE